jgi:hypothetical protein
MPKLSNWETLEKILKLARKKGGTTRYEVADKLDISYPYAAGLLTSLVKNKSLRDNERDGREIVYRIARANSASESVLVSVKRIGASELPELNPPSEGPPGTEFMVGGRRVILEDDMPVMPVEKPASQSEKLAQVLDNPLPPGPDEKIAMLEKRAAELSGELLKVRSELLTVYTEALKDMAK